MPAPAVSGFILLPPSGDADTLVANAPAGEQTLPPGAAGVEDVVESMFADAIPTIPGRPSTHRPSVAPTIVSPAPEVTGPPATAIPTPAPAPPVEQARPLPGYGDEAPELRSVLPRSAVGAQVWSSWAVHSDVDEDQSQGIVAPETHATTIEADANLPRVVAPPPASGTSHTADGTAAAPTPAADRRPLGPGQERLAHDLGLSEDELALALSAGDSTLASPPSATAHPTARVVDQDLADVITAQIEEGGEDGGEARLRVGRQADEAAAPAPNVRSDDDNDNDDDDDGDPIHHRQTAVDLEPLPPIDRFGISWPVAAGLFLAGFILFVVVIRSCTGAEAGHASLATDVDAGAEAIAPPGEAPPLQLTTPEPSALPEPTPPPSSTTDTMAIAEQPPAPPAVPTPVTEPAPEPPAPPPAPEPTPASTATPEQAAASTPTPEQAAEPTPTTGVDDDATRYVRQLKAADALAAKGRHGRSVKAYKAALVVNPDGVAAHLGLGNAYYELDSLDAALVHLEKARKLAPDDPQVYVLLGTAYQSANRTAEAVSAYERYLVLAPDGRFARDVRGILKSLRR
jgi:hypothetical protein